MKLCVALAINRSGKLFPFATTEDPAILRSAARKILGRRQRETALLTELAGAPTKCARRTAKKAKGQS